MTENTIITPTDKERKLFLTFAWTGNGLDASIEEAEKRNSFFVSGFQFTEQTLARMGIKPSRRSRKAVLDAFYKAHFAIVTAICEMQNEVS